MRLVTGSGTTSAARPSFLELRRAHRDEHRLAWNTEHDDDEPGRGVGEVVAVRWLTHRDAAECRGDIVAAFALAEGESSGALLEQAPAGAALAHLDVDQHGFAWLPEDDFVKHFAADVDPIKAKVMFAVQQPLHWSALGEVMGAPAWKSLPTWFLVADGDQAIPPDAQRQFAPRMGATSVEIATNHVAMVAHPDDVLQLIKKAAGAASR